MSQFLDCTDSDFLLYYTRPERAGTPDFEHKVRIPYSAIRQAMRADNTPDDGVVLVDCPCGCGASASVPVAGNEEAQRVHARYRAAAEGKPYIEQAVRETMERVREKGGVPRLDPKKG